jgi:hypothetical protein
MRSAPTKRNLEYVKRREGQGVGRRPVNGARWQMHNILLQVREFFTNGLPPPDSGAPGETRTLNLRFRRPLLYPIEVQAQTISQRLSTNLALSTRFERATFPPQETLALFARS